MIKIFHTMFYVCCIRATRSAILTNPSWLVSMVSRRKSHCSEVIPSPLDSLVRRCLSYCYFTFCVQKYFQWLERIIFILQKGESEYDIPDVTHWNKTFTINIEHSQALSKLQTQIIIDSISSSVTSSLGELLWDLQTLNTSSNWSNVRPWPLNLITMSRICSDYIIIIIWQGRYLWLKRILSQTSHRVSDLVLGQESWTITEVLEHLLQCWTGIFAIIIRIF